ncbi:alpha/beta fold hydrolase [Terriglobus sp. TAA 43]|uniref:alpha/beta fold hydrolase n=1 Tax=Terriglobus sp. TAA 43 TaxID=278961 RepID=UPI0012EEA64B|nr:hypothetical protein [Terriglobus sp. TAA 43]
MKRLIVLAPSIGHTTIDFDPLLERLSDEPLWNEKPQILRYEHRVHLLSSKRADDLAEDLAQRIQTRWYTEGPFDEITLMGNSLGGILVRAAYLRGLGSAKNREEPQEWASRVHRIVLFAAFNRGVHLRWYERFSLFFLPWARLIRDIMIGSDFVTNVRLWWIRKLSTRDANPIVVQIRGTDDRRVERNDSLDVEGFLEGFEMTLEATHGSLLRFDRDDSGNDEKYSIFRQAILGDFKERNHGGRVLDASQSTYIVLHGIRDSNDNWVEKLSNLISSQFAGAKIIPPTYGRFSALQFLIPTLRRKKLRWFQDLYSSELAKNPKATFNFIGHSYGTYLFGYSISHLNGMVFKRVSLNGSVLPAQWDWDLHRSQVSELRNARAQKDFPVGVLCSALRGIHMRDVGTAGYTGFQIPFGQHSEVFYYRGGHGASVSKQARPDILAFLVSGTAGAAIQAEFVEEDEGFSRLSAGAWIIPPLLLLSYCVLCVGGASGVYVWKLGPIASLAQIFSWAFFGILSLIAFVLAVIAAIALAWI